MSVSPKVRQVVYERDGGCCGWCGRYCMDEPHSLQHRRARAMGGSVRSDTNTASNLVLLDGSGTTGCHGRVEAAPELARHYGYRLFQTETPSQAPVWTARLGWIQLDDLGGFTVVDDPDPETTARLQQISDVILDLGRAL